jgi:SAM-dependent methyltransferase
MRVGAIALYEEALHERAAWLVLRTEDGRGLPLPVARWCGRPDAADEELIRHCRGPVLDVGCGPGRLTVALTERGIPALGVDISPTAIARVRQAGALALHRSVVDPLPGQGRWATVLLADGNIGIGGLPARLLHRCAQLLAPGGRILIEAEPGNVDEHMSAWLEHPDGRRGPAFPWARMGTAALVSAAAEASLDVIGQWRHADRAFVWATTRAAREIDLRAERAYCRLRNRLREPDPHGEEELRRPQENGAPGVGHGNETVGSEPEEGREPGIVTQLGGRPLIPAEDGRVQPGSAPEDQDRRVRGGLQGHVRLLLPAAREPVLRPAAGRAAAVDGPRADLGRTEGRRVAGEHAGRVPAEADEEDADSPLGHGVRRDRRRDGGRGAVRLRQREQRFAERGVAARDRAVRRGERYVVTAGRYRQDRLSIRLAGGRPDVVPNGERGHPAAQPLRRNIEPFTATTCDVLHYLMPHRVY